VSVGVGFDDGDDARYKWLPTGHPDAPNEWEGTDFEQHLVNDINSCIAAKCLNSYGPNCLLAVYVDADMTTAVEMEGAFRPNTALKAFTFALNLYRLSTHWLPGCLNMANNRRSEACGNSIPRLFEG
jgi:hypothetical protein